MLTNPIVAIIFQYIHIANHYTVHLKGTQCYKSVTAQSWKIKKNYDKSVLAETQP